MTKAEIIAYVNVVEKECRYPDRVHEVRGDPVQGQLVYGHENGEKAWFRVLPTNGALPGWLEVDTKGARLYCNDDVPKLCQIIREQQEEIEQLRASFPYYSGRDENKANIELGEVMRHSMGETSSIGVVDATVAKSALLQAYGEANALNDIIEKRNDMIAWMLDFYEWLQSNPNAEDIGKWIREARASLEKSRVVGT